MNSNVKTDKEPRSNRRKLFKLHSWVGFNLAFIMSLVLATGTIATISYEIDWLVQADMRVTPGEEKVSWQTMTDAVKSYAPDSSLISIQALRGDYLAYRATVKDEYDRRYFIHVNQWTGEVTGETGVITVQRVFRDLHRYMFMPNFIGLPIVCSMAFILLISLYTGLKTARNWKTLMTRVRFNKGSRVMVGDAHKAAGLWGIWFLLLMAITGIWYLAEFIAGMNAYFNKNAELAFEPARPTLSVERLDSIGNIIKSSSTNEIILAAETAFPEIKDNISIIYFPFNVNQPIAVLGERGNPILRPRANRVFLDPESLEPIKVQRSEEISWIAWLNETADPLHFGFFGGLTTKLIWFVFGVGLTGLSITGVYLTWKRLDTRQVSRAQYSTFPVFIMASLFCFLFWYPGYKTPNRPHSEHGFFYQSDKQVQLASYLGVNKDQQFDGNIRLLLKAQDGRANVKQATIELFKNGESLGDAIRLKQRLFSTTSIFKGKLPKQLLGKASEILLSVELNTGETISTNWAFK